MLTKTPHPFTAQRGAVGDFPARQRGVVLMISLIILVVMTLGGIALMRSISTTGLISGNLAFQQAATRAGEAGTEAAIRNVLLALPASDLWTDKLAVGYVASTPAAGNPTDWDAYWRNTINPNPVTPPASGVACADRACTLPRDAAGNVATYTIQRLCQTAGDPQETPTGCSNTRRVSPLAGGNLGPGNMPVLLPTQYFYRVTTRVVGPRNTTSYIQTIVAL